MDKYFEDYKIIAESRKYLAANYYKHSNSQALRNSVQTERAPTNI